jgi:hypothetical protein
MPGGKQRLLSLLTTGLKVGSASTDTFMMAILAGSVSITGPAFTGDTAGSREILEATIAGLTASHSLQVTPEGISPCIALVGACAGVGKASMIFSYIAGSNGAAAAAATTVINYFAVRT